MMDLLSAIEFLHSQQPPIIHRDLKPANLSSFPTRPNSPVLFPSVALACIHKGDTGKGFAGRAKAGVTGMQDVDGRHDNFKVDRLRAEPDCDHNSGEVQHRINQL